VRQNAIGTIKNPPFGDLGHFLGIKRNEFETIMYKVSYYVK